MLTDLESLLEATARVYGSAEKPKAFLITTQAKRNLSNRSGIGGVLSAT